MKQIQLIDPMFDGYVGGISRRVVANELLSNRTVFKSPIIKKLEKIRNWTIIALMVIALVAFSAVISGWIHIEQGYKQGITDAYYQKNKITKTNYAGAGGEGRVMKEGKYGH